MTGRNIIDIYIINLNWTLNIKNITYSQPLQDMRENDIITSSNNKNISGFNLKSGNGLDVKKNRNVAL